MNKGVVKSTVERRQGERRFWCRVWINLGLFWDWIDERQIDAHFISASIVGGFLYVVYWATTYAENHADKSGADVGLIIGAVTGPMAIALPIALGFILRAREKTFANPKEPE